MKRQAVLVNAGAAVALLAWSTVAPAQTVQPCANPSNCVQVSVGSGSGKVGDVVTVPVTFQQGPDNGQGNGPGQIAALAMTIGIPGSGSGAPLVLNDCTVNADGLPAAVKPSAALSGFRVVVENASCGNGHTHCLCPPQGQTPDNFINLVVYGPNPLPTPGASGITIPILPNGQLFTIDLNIASGSGTIPLHVFNQVDDTTHPAFTALLSVGDKTAVDQTCSPLAVPGVSPPCTASGSVSQVAITQGSVAVTPGPTAVCAGDCNGNGHVAVNEIIVLVNIILQTAQPSACMSGIPSGAAVNISLVLKAVNNDLNGCPAT